ncbi:MAG: LysM peptidoglycan-binding domain-containing protein [Dehalococcoidia bacterium]|nr:LysM peptidoglycan-binding domain-containing protein [Dehalococcoidia bacterium]
MTLALALLVAVCADEDLDTTKRGKPPSITVMGVGAGARRTERVTISLGAPTGREQLPVFYRVQVHPGDTVEIVARRFGISPEYVVWNNEGALRNGEPVEGSLLALPSRDGILHEIRLGETLSEIAARYGVALQDILDFPANGIGNPTTVPARTILVPGARKP